MEKPKNNLVRLNKYIALCGICSRRDADLLIAEGKIRVNSTFIREVGYKLQLKDTVYYKGKIIKPENKVYVLLNKPKGYITSLVDEQNRKTVMDLVKNATKDRIFPIGRLDYNTQGVLLLTNDGELSHKLSHPSFEVQKVYIVQLHKELQQQDLDTIKSGFQLEDGKVSVDKISYLNSKDEIRIEIHSGKTRIVRRIFEHFGYKINKLERVAYAGITTSGIQIGNWRFLSSKEIQKLQKL